MISKLAELTTAVLIGAFLWLIARDFVRARRHRDRGGVGGITRPKR
jgi:hypothetical protein